MSPVWRNRIGGLFLAGIVYFIDQAIKGWVRFDLNLPAIGSFEIMPIFRLSWTQNFGVSLGMFTAGSPEGRWLLVALTFAIATFVFFWMMRERKLLDIAALGLVLGGAAGNIHDRALLGYVVDYADLHFGEFRPFLVFNLADAAITIGVLIILARSLLSREKPETETPASNRADEPAPES